jgi:hypothetical protein
VNDQQTLETAPCPVSEHHNMPLEDWQKEQFSMHPPNTLVSVNCPECDQVYSVSLDSLGLEGPYKNDFR